MEKLEPWCTAPGAVKWYGLEEISLVILQKVKHRMTI